MRFFGLTECGDCNHRHSRGPNQKELGHRWGERSVAVSRNCFINHGRSGGDLFRGTFSFLCKLFPRLQFPRMHFEHKNSRLYCRVVRHYRFCLSLYRTSKKTAPPASSVRGEASLTRTFSVKAQHRPSVLSERLLHHRFSVLLSGTWPTADKVRCFGRCCRRFDRSREALCRGICAARLSTRNKMIEATVDNDGLRRQQHKSRQATAEL